MTRLLTPRLLRASWLVLAILTNPFPPLSAQESAEVAPGQFFSVGDPITTDTIVRIRADARKVLERHAAEGKRPVLVFEFQSPTGDGQVSSFGSALDLAKLISTDLAGALTVAFVPKPLKGYVGLAALACDEIAMGSDASIGPMTPEGEEVDPSYREPVRRIAQRKGKDPALILGLLDRDADLRLVKTVDGEIQYLLAEDLPELRKTKEVVEERPAWEAGRRGVLSAETARERGFAQLIADRRSEVAAGYRMAGESVTEDPTLGRELRPLLIRVQGVIDPVKKVYLGARIERARRDGVNLIIFRIDSPGGLDTAADAAADLIVGLTDIKTVALIEDRALGVSALLALACHEIAFTETATIGDVRQLLTGRRGHPESLDDRQIQSLARKAAHLAEQRGHPAAVASAMVDPAATLLEAKDAKTGGRVFVLRRDADAEPGRFLDPLTRKEAGQVLTVGSNEAESFGLGRSVQDLEGLKALLGLKGRTIPEDGPTWVDSLVTLLVDPFVSWVLLFVGLFMLVVELKLPGIGLPAITSALAFLLFFWSHYLTGTADQLEIILFLVGMVCLALEIFVFPGFGVFGMSGILLVLASIVMASHSFAWPTQEYEYREMGYTLLQVTLAMACVAGGAAVLAHYFPSLPIFNRLVLKPEPWGVGGAGVSADDPFKPPLEGYDSLAYLIGETGRATTVLRPSGKAKFGDQLLDVTAPGSFIEPGSLVEVIDVQGPRVIVKQALL